MARGKHATRAQARYDRHADDQIGALTAEIAQLRRRNLDLERTAEHTGALRLALTQAETDRDQATSPTVRTLHAELAAAKDRIRQVEASARRRNLDWVEFVGDLLERISPSQQVAVHECLLGWAARLGIATQVHPAFGRRHPERPAELSVTRMRQQQATKQGRDAADEELQRNLGKVKRVVEVTAADHDQATRDRQGVGDLDVTGGVHGAVPTDA